MILYQREQKLASFTFAMDSKTGHMYLHTQYRSLSNQNVLSPNAANVYSPTP